MIWVLTGIAALIVALHAVLLWALIGLIRETREFAVMALTARGVEWTVKS